MTLLTLTTFLFLLAALPFGCTADKKDLPSPWQQRDIGAVSVPGNANTEKGVFTLKGTLDIWGTSDGCQYVWQPLKGKGTSLLDTNPPTGIIGYNPALSQFLFREPSPSVW